MKKLIAFILAAAVLVISVCAAPAVDDPVEVEVIEPVTDQIESKALSLSDPGISLLSYNYDQTTALNKILEAIGYVYDGSGSVISVLGSLFELQDINQSGFSTLRTWLQNINQNVSASVSLLDKLATVPARMYALWYDGTLYLNEGSISFLDMIRYGLGGLGTILRGDQNFNSNYSVNILGNDNEIEETTQFGMGPMINAWLDAIEKNSGNLAFMFASPEDVAAKGDSSSNLGAATDEMLSPDADASVKVSDIKSMSSISSGLKKYGDTGVSIGDMFGSLGDDSVFSFFSQETADNLDSTITTFSRDPRTQIVTNYYEQSREEFDSRVGKDGE